MRVDVLALPTDSSIAAPQVHTALIFFFASEQGQRRASGVVSWLPSPRTCVLRVTRTNVARVWQDLGRRKGDPKHLVRDKSEIEGWGSFEGGT